MISLLTRLGQGVLDLVYPMHCLVCGASGESEVLCGECVATFEPIPEPTCAICGRPVDPAPCSSCARRQEATAQPWGFDSALGAAIYGGALRRAIHRLKYENKENLGLPLGAFLANRLIVDGLLKNPGAIDAVAAIPISVARERMRGYNQARLLAEPIATMLGVPLLSERAILRSGSATAQAGLSDRARRANVAPEAFSIPDITLVAGKQLLLIDDVFTTGTTVSACAQALKKAGAAPVHIATLAAGG